jgi:hypothetical protein
MRNIWDSSKSHSLMILPGSVSPKLTSQCSPP